MNDICQFPKLDNKKILFLAETNYQLINCINIAYHTQNSKCVLFINEIYENTADIANKIDGLNIFDKTEIYSTSKRKILKTFRFAFLEKFISKIFNDFDYDVVLFASRDFVARCVITYVKYYRQSTELISYDEGLGTYTSRMESYTNKVEEFLIKILHNDKPSILTDKILYEPRAYIGEAKNIKLYKMPVINNNVLDKINILYDFNDEMKINNKYIYFDGYFDGLNDTNKKVIELLAKKTRNQLVIKKHPQTPIGTYTAGVEYQYSNIPFEVIVANDYDIQNKVLITSISTAVWTPMLLYNKYPKIILLYPIFNVVEAKDIIEKFISLYDKNRVIVIRSYDELEKLRFD